MVRQLWIPVILPTSKGVHSVPTIYIAARHAVKDVQNAFAKNNYKLISFDGYYVLKNYRKLISVRDNYFDDEKSVETYNAILMAMLTGSVEVVEQSWKKICILPFQNLAVRLMKYLLMLELSLVTPLSGLYGKILGHFKAYLCFYKSGLRQFKSLQKRMIRLSREWALTPDLVTAVRAGLAAENGRMAVSFFILTRRFGMD